MKKLTKIFKVRRFKDSIPVHNLKDFTGDEYIILYRYSKYKYVYSKDDLLDEIRKHGDEIYYIFDMVDRIILEKSIIVEEYGYK